MGYHYRYHAFLSRFRCWLTLGRMSLICATSAEFATDGNHR